MAAAEAANELARFAMRCHVAYEGLSSEVCVPGDIADVYAWGGLQCNDMTGKVEALDSPLEPGVHGKREASFQTQMVRRAVSFIFEDGAGSPVDSRRSPAVAA